MNRLGKNFVYQLSYQFVSFIIPLVTAPYISRVLGAELLGEYTYTNTIAYYFYIASMLGIETYGARIIAAVQDERSKRSRLFCEVFSVQLVLSLLGIMAYAIFVCFFAKDYKLLLSIQFLYVSSTFLYIPWYYVGIEDFKKIAIRNLILKIATAILIFTAINGKEDLGLYTVIMAGSTFVSNFLFWIQLKRSITFSRVNIFESLNKHFRKILLLFVPQIGITLFMYMDKIMLGWWAPMNELGYYQNAEKIINIPIAIIMSLGAVIMPRAASINASGDYVKLKSFNAVSTSAFMIMSTGCMFGLAAIADDFAPWFFGEEFTRCAILISALAVTVLLMGWENAIQKQYLIPVGKDRIVATCMIVAAIVNLVIDILLIPSIGAFGAIVGSIAAHLSICIIEGIYVRKNLPVVSYLTNTVGYLLCGAIMYSAVYMFSKSYHANIAIKIIIEIAIGVVIYMTTVLLYINVKKTDEHGMISGYVNRLMRKLIHKL